MGKHPHSPLQTNLNYWPIQLLKCKILLYQLMKERFNPKTQEISLYISQDELTHFLGPGGLEGLRLVNDEKKVFFLLFRGLNDEADDAVTSVHPEYNRTSRASGESGYTDFFILLSSRACIDLELHGRCEDRYIGKTGLERVSVTVGDPE